MAVTWKDNITFKVEIGFATAPWAASTTWTDVTDDLRDVPNISRGSGSEYGASSVGSATVVLDNRDRKYDPEYSSGTYFGDLIPMKRIRITATYDSVDYILFTGHITEYQQVERAVHGDNEMVAVLPCVGASYFLNRKLAGSAYQQKTLALDPILYWPMQTLIGDEFEEVIGRGGDNWNALSLGADLNGSSTPALAWPSPTTLNSPVGESSYYLTEKPLGSFQDPGPYATTNPIPEGPYMGFSAWIPSVYDFGNSDVDTDGTDAQSWLFVQENTAGGTSDDSFQVKVFGPAYISTGRITDVWDTRILVSIVYTNNTNSRYVSTGVFSILPAPTGDAVHLAVRADSSNLYTYVNGRLFRTDALSVGTRDSDLGAGSGVGGETAGVLRMGHVAVWGSTVPTQDELHDTYMAGLDAYHPNTAADRTGTRIGRILDAIGHPSSQRNLETGVTICDQWITGETTALAAINQIANSEQGLFFFDREGDARFLDREWLHTDWENAPVLSDTQASGTIPYSQVSRVAQTVRTVINEVTVGDATATDATSITAHGPIAASIQASELPTFLSRRSLARYVLRNKKDPKDRFETVQIEIRHPSQTLSEVLDLDLGDIVDIVRTPAAVGSAVTERVIITQIQDRIGVDSWVRSLTLGAAPINSTDGDYYNLGSGAELLEDPGGATIEADDAAGGSDGVLLADGSSDGRSTLTQGEGLLPA